jgi:hypothetical protein
MEAGVLARVAKGVGPRKPTTIRRRPPPPRAWRANCTGRFFSFRWPFGGWGGAFFLAFRWGFHAVSGSRGGPAGPPHTLAAVPIGRSGARLQALARIGPGVVRERT